MKYTAGPADVTNAADTPTFNGDAADLRSQFQGVLYFTGSSLPATTQLGDLFMYFTIDLCNMVGAPINTDVSSLETKGPHYSHIFSHYTRVADKHKAKEARRSEYVTLASRLSALESKSEQKRSVSRSSRRTKSPDGD